MPTVIMVYSLWPHYRDDVATGQILAARTKSTRLRTKDILDNEFVHPDNSVPDWLSRRVGSLLIGGLSQSEFGSICGHLDVPLPRDLARRFLLLPVPFPQ